MAFPRTKNRRFFSGLFLSAFSLAIVIKEYVQKEADHAIILQAIGAMLIGIGLMIGKTL